MMTPQEVDNRTRVRACGSRGALRDIIMEHGESGEFYSITEVLQVEKHGL